MIHRTHNEHADHGWYKSIAPTVQSWLSRNVPREGQYILKEGAA